MPTSRPPDPLGPYGAKALGEPPVVPVLAVIANAVANATGHPVGFVATDWVDVSQAQAAIDSAPAGSVLILENTRFHPGEEANDADLAARMASLGDVYINVA